MGEEKAKGITQEQWQLMRDAIVIFNGCTRAGGRHQAEALRRDQRLALLEAAEKHAADRETLDKALAETVQAILDTPEPASEPKPKTKEPAEKESPSEVETKRGN